MKIISWNCRGLATTDTLNFLKAMPRKYKPDCIFLMETKMDEVRMEKVHKALNYANFFTVKAKANGLAGGLLLL